MRSKLFIPLAAGLLTGLGLYVVREFLPYVSLCVVVMFIMSILAIALSPLGSGRAFSGWTRTSPTAISGMNSDIRSRSGWSTSDRLGALVYLLSSILIYYLATLVLPS